MNKGDMHAMTNISFTDIFSLLLLLMSVAFYYDLFFRRNVGEFILIFC